MLIVIKCRSGIIDGRIKLLQKHIKLKLIHTNWRHLARDIPAEYNKKNYSFGQ